MIKKFFWIALTLGGISILSACAQESAAEPKAPAPEIPQDTDHEISVRIKDFPGEELYLAYHFGDKQYIRDTAKIVEGVATFKGDTALPGGIYMIVTPPQNQYFEIIVDKDQHFSLETDTLDFSGNMKVSGSDDNEVFFSDLQFLASRKERATVLIEKQKTLPKGSAEAKSVQDELGKLDKEVKGHRNDLKEKYPYMLYAKVLRALEEPEVPEAPIVDGIKDSLFPFRYYRAHFFDQVDFQDDRLLRTPVLYNKANQYLERLTYKHPDSISKSIDIIVEKTRGNDEVFQFFVVNFLNKYANSKIMGMDGVYVHMVEKYYMSGDAFWVDEETLGKMEERAVALSPNLIGRPAPDVVMRDMQGEWKSLYDVKAPYTILYFWDYDCGHCKKVTPELAKAYNERLKDKGLALYAVSINGDIEVWKNKVAEYELDQGLNVQDHRRQSGFDDKYDIRSTPRLFLLDEEKKILAKHISVEQLEEILEKLL